MADELALRLKFEYTKSSTSHRIDSGSLSVDVTGTNSLQHRQSVSTSEEALELGDVTAGGYCIMVNRDATNYVQVKPATGETALIRLKAGEFCVFRLDAGATAPFVQANTAACEIEYAIIED